MPSSNPNQKILECVNAGLQILGESAKDAIYFYAEKNFGLNKTEIPEKPQAFSVALTSVFGEGAKTIEGLIVQEMRQTFKLNIRHELTFAEAVLLVKAKKL